MNLIIFQIGLDVLIWWLWILGRIIFALRLNFIFTILLFIIVEKILNLCIVVLINHPVMIQIKLRKFCLSVYTIWWYLSSGSYSSLAIYWNSMEIFVSSNFTTSDSNSSYQLIRFSSSTCNILEMISFTIYDLEYKVHCTASVNLGRIEAYYQSSWLDWVDLMHSMLSHRIEVHRTAYLTTIYRI